MDSLVGQKVRGYEFKERLGSGGFGVVYRAYQPVIDRSVAVKVILPEYASQPDFLHRFEQEARLVGQLEHPHIVPLFDFWHDQERAYLVMRWLPMTLRQTLTQPMDYQHALRLLEQTASALTFAHRHGVIHCDIKPDNILLDDEGNAYLSDFGIARSVDHETDHEFVEGTLIYIAPEQLREGVTSIHSDVYAIGVLAYEMLTGQPPFGGMSTTDLIRHKLRNEALPGQPLAEFPLVQPVITRATHHEPAVRYGTASGFVAAFREALSNQLADNTTERLSVADQRRMAELSSQAISPTPQTSTVRGLDEQRRHASAFVGREKELHDIGHLLQNPDVFEITILAPGGMGKTRLALESGHTHATLFPDGTFFVSLTHLQEPVELIFTIADHVGLDVVKSTTLKHKLLNYLADRSLLLILDNFEHVMDAAPLVSEIIQATTKVKVIVTSRERLNLQVESVYALGGLPFPEPSHSLCEASDCDSVRLLQQAMARVRPDFCLDEQTMPAARRICYLTQGMPLAIELAAGWADMLPLDAIADQIERDISILESDLRDIPERHRSVRAIFNYSLEQLTTAERSTFMRLSVFQGGFDVQAAQAVAQADLRVLRKLASKALIYPLGPGRYEMHQLLRQYGQALLHEAQSLDAARDAHADYFARFMHECEPALKNNRQLEALAQIAGDDDNIKSAWFWAISRINAQAVDHMLEGLYQFWFAGRHIEMDEAYVRPALEAFTPLDDQQEPHPVLGRLLARSFAFLPQPLASLNEALAIAERVGTRSDVAFALQTQGLLNLMNQQYDQAILRYQQSLEHYRALDDAFGIADVYTCLGYSYSSAGQPETALEHYARGVELARRIGNVARIAFGLSPLGLYALLLGQYSTAETYCQEAIRLNESLTASWGGLGRWGGISFIGLGLLNLLNARFEESQATTQTLEHELALTLYNAESKGFLYILQGWQAALIDVDYAQAVKLCEQGQALLQDATMLGGYSPPLYEAGMALATVGQGQFDAARRHLFALLTHASERQLTAPMLWALVAAVLLLVHEGQYEWAARLEALARSHPKNLTGWLDQWPPLGEASRMIQKTLDPATYAAIQDETYTLQPAVEDLLRHLDGVRV